MNPTEPAPEESSYGVHDYGQLNLGIVESIDPVAFEQSPSQQLGVYAEQKRQARGAFNICRLFAWFGVLQGVAGIFSVLYGRALGISPIAATGLLGAGGLFGILSNWGYKLSDSANALLAALLV